MNLFMRLKSRITNEGICRTIFYMICVSFYCLRECFFNAFYDLKYSKKILKGNMTSSHKYMGANDVYHTKYSVLPIIFKLVPIKEKDVLVDVGCGKGRIINYWLSKKLKNKIIGLELDKNVAYHTAQQFAKKKNVTIIQGNALDNIPEDGTLFYFYNPFSEEVVEKFEAKLSQMFPKKTIKIIYYNPKSIHVFYNGNWNVKYINFEHDLGCIRWGRINKFHDLAIIKNKVNITDES